MAIREVIFIKPLAGFYHAAHYCTGGPIAVNLQDIKLYYHPGYNSGNVPKITTYYEEI